MAKKEEVITLENKREIIWNVANALLLGSAVFLGAFIDGQITKAEILASAGSAAILFITKLSDYVKSQKSEYVKMFGNFI